MKLNPEDFEQAFRDAFDNAETEPSFDLWNGIEASISVPTFEQSVKQKFEGAEAEPSGKVWANIENELHKVRPLLFNRWMKAAGIAASAALLIGTAWFAQADENGNDAVSNDDTRTVKHSGKSDETKSEQSGLTIVPDSESFALTEKRQEKSEGEPVKEESGLKEFAQNENLLTGSKKPAQKQEIVRTILPSVKSEKNSHLNPTISEPIPALHSAAGIPASVFAELNDAQIAIHGLPALRLSEADLQNEKTSGLPLHQFGIGVFYGTHSPAFVQNGNAVLVQGIGLEDSPVAEALKNKLSQRYFSAFSADYRHRIGRRMYLAGGLQYVKSAYSADITLLQKSISSAQSSDYIRLSDKLDVTEESIFVPIELIVSSDREKWNTEIGAGFTGSVLLAQNKSNNLFFAEYDLGQPAKFGLSAGMHLGLNYRLVPGLSWGAEIRARQAITDFYGSGSLSSKPFGLSVGSVIRFGF